MNDSHSHGTPGQLAVNPHDTVVHDHIVAEKKLCELLGRSWATAGISILGLIDQLHQKLTAPDAPTELLVAGDRVMKVGGDYTFDGPIVSVFRKTSGAVRYVVEDDRGVLHIFSRKQLSPIV